MGKIKISIYCCFFYMLQKAALKRKYECLVNSKALKSLCFVLHFSPTQNKSCLVLSLWVTVYKFQPPKITVIYNYRTFCKTFCTFQKAASELALKRKRELQRNEFQPPKTESEDETDDELANDVELTKYDLSQHMRALVLITQATS